MLLPSFSRKSDVSICKLKKCVTVHGKTRAPYGRSPLCIFTLMRMFFICPMLFGVVLGFCFLGLCVRYILDEVCARIKGLVGNLADVRYLGVLKLFD